MKEINNMYSDELKMLKNNINKQLHTIDKELKQVVDNDDIILRVRRMKYIMEALKEYSPQRLKEKRGEITIKDPDTGDDEIIRLNRKLTIEGNCQLLQKKIEKCTTKWNLSNKRVISLTEQKKQYSTLFHSLSQLSYQSIDESSYHKSLNTIKNQLALLGVSIDYYKQNTKTPFRQYTFRSYTIYVGKNASQNDELSTRFTSASDLWFHAAHCAGSHVVIKCPKHGTPPNNEVIKAVASIAAWFSKARKTSSVEVHYCNGLCVHKRPHAPKGEVIIEHFSTIQVEPQSPENIFIE